LNCEYIYKVARDKCIPLGIKDDNVPPKFVVPIENVTLKDHNSYKSGLTTMEHMETKEIHNYGINLNK
jgi:hypothetical protein